MFNALEYKDSFEGPAKHELYDVVVEGTEQVVVDRALSKSFVTSLPEAQKDTVVSQIRKIVQKGDGKVWIDEAKGTFEYPYTTGPPPISRPGPQVC